MSIPIPSNPRGLPQSTFVGTSPTQTLSTSPRMSTSPSAAGSFGGRSLKAFGTARQLHAFLPAAFPAFPEEEGTATPRTGKIKILLLENISLEAAQFLKNAGYEVSRKGVATTGRCRNWGAWGAPSCIRDLPLAW